MNKIRLQELCQKRMWSLPVYTGSRHGPDHNPLFGACVVVNGQTYDAPNPSKSLKEAQNKAAEVALEHLSAIPPASPAAAHPAGHAPPPATTQISYKSQLLEYTQKRKISVPKYISVYENSAHSLRFKARVTVDGQTFESSQYFNTLREAEHSAASVALMSLPLEENQRVALMSLPLEENHRDEPKFYKILLQELVQKEGLCLPIYKTQCDGEPHMPIFRSTVVLDGESFVGDVARSKKQAEINAAKVAFNHITAQVQISYKSQLQDYVQKRKNCVPEYISVSEGSPHSLQFKARVTVDGQIFESSQYFNTLREAEHSAARVALMSLPLEENHQDEPKFYKNLLQELVQKKGLSLPIYNTQCDGESHMPIFTSTVVLDGESFVGDVARSKKQAEMNAAKVALNHITGRINAHSVNLTCGEAIDSLEQPKIHTVEPSAVRTEETSQTAVGNNACLAEVIQPASGLSLEYQVKHDDSPISLRNHLDQPYLYSIPTSTLKIKEDHLANGDTNALEQQNGLSVSISNVKTKEEKQFNGKIEYYGRVVANKAYHEVLTNASMTMNEADDGIFSFDSTDKLDISNLKLDSSGGSAKNGSAVVNNSCNIQNENTHHDEILSSDLVDQLNFSDLKLDLDGGTKQEDSKAVSSDDIDTEAFKDDDADVDKIINSPSLLCNRVLVHPRKPDIVLPVGATLLPFSDDAWVAVSLDFSEHEDNLPTIQ